LPWGPPTTAWPPWGPAVFQPWTSTGWTPGILYLELRDLPQLLTFKHIKGTPDENMATLPYSGCPLLLPTASSIYIIKEGTGPLTLGSNTMVYSCSEYGIDSFIKFFAIPLFKTYVFC
jgi:hypothetical protein